jgi:hypothetical protein
VHFYTKLPATLPTPTRAAAVADPTAIPLGAGHPGYVFHSAPEWIRRRGGQAQEPHEPGRTDADGTERGRAARVGEDSGLPDSSARRLARVDSPVLTSGRGRETSSGIIYMAGQVSLESPPRKTLIDPGQRVRNVDHRMGSARLWRPCTPAMAAGLTDHIWSLKEVLFYRVPPWPQAQTV